MCPYFIRVAGLPQRLVRPEILNIPFFKALLFDWISRKTNNP